MIRNAAAVALRRQRRALTIGGCAGACAYGTYAICESNATDEPSTRSIARPLDLVIPTLQATGRAANLVGTVAAMIYDYECGKLQKSLMTSEDLLVPTFLLGPQNEEEKRVLQLEQTVEACRFALEQAQEDYTGKGDENAAKKQIKQEDLRKRVHLAAQHLAEAEEQLADHGGDFAGRTHKKAADRLLRLCRENGGVYVKIGQHLANLDYLIPTEYIEALQHLFDNAPETSYDDVREVIREDLGCYPEELFDEFDPKPIASASLAQVHVAYHPSSKQKLAIKVQHRGLRETSRGDIVALQIVVKALEWAFPDEFRYGWIMEEIAPQLPKELDFKNEGKNAEKAAKHIKESGLNCIVPAVHWDNTSERLLTMDFEEGFRSTDMEAIQKANMKNSDVARLISSIFNSQVFLSGFIHCDPHPANCLLRADKDGKPQIVLVDHGLYKQIDCDFRLNYAKLWKALMLADIPQIKEACNKLGIGAMYPLLAAMLVGRPFDEIVERSKTGSFEANQSSGAGSTGDKAMIRGYAQRFIIEILELLDAVPRQMLLLFKMNDCLRHIDMSLGSPNNTLVTAGKFAAKACRDAEKKDKETPPMQSWYMYQKLRGRIYAYEWISWFKRT